MGNRIKRKKIVCFTVGDKALKMKPMIIAFWCSKKSERRRPLMIFSQDGKVESSN